MMIIDEKTRIPLTMFVSAIITCVAGTFWLNSQFGDIKTRLTLIEAGMQRRFTLNDMKLWAAELKSSNPTIVVPIPETGRGRDINN